MPKPAGHRKVVLATLSAANVVAALSACLSPLHASSVPGTTPSVWTGSPAPSGSAAAEGASEGKPSITTHLPAPDGTQVATAAFDFSNDYATITIATTGVGGITPGFHSVRIHKIGKREPNSVAPPAARPATSSRSAAITKRPATPPNPKVATSPSCRVRKDGIGTRVTTTDAVTTEDC